MSGEKAETVEFLVPLEVYLAAGVHIGTHIGTKHMTKFVYKIRPDGLHILDVRQTDERLRIAAKFIARYDPSKIVAVSVRQYGHKPVQKFCSFIRCKAITGRILPGTFTNPKLEHYAEPELLVVTDPRSDSQALKEAAKVGIPVVAFCDSDNKTDYVELIIPANNKGRKALALLYWLLTRQVLRERGDIPPNGELPVSVDEFETKIIKVT